MMAVLFMCWSCLCAVYVLPLLKEEDAMATEIEDENGGFWVMANSYAKEN
jgi:hypothetical protein